MLSNPFIIRFSKGSSSWAIHIFKLDDLQKAISILGLNVPACTILLLGGANKMTQIDKDIVYPFFVNVLAPLANKHKAIVVDAGVDVGVMQLMGHARAEIQADFPLVGVAVSELLILPGEEIFINKRPIAPEPNHTHFILVPGDNWSSEASWLVEAANIVAQEKPLIVIVINGGDTTLEELSYATKIKKTVIVVAGSGRLADSLDSVIQTEGTNPDQRIKDLIMTGLFSSINIKDGYNTTQQKLENLLLEQLN